MKHIILHIIIGKRVLQVKAAETGLEPSPLQTPSLIRGKLVGLTVEEILDIKHGSEVKVGFDSGQYQFTRLERAGQFELRRITE
jgi:hypothetical protein